MAQRGICIVKDVSQFHDTDDVSLNCIFIGFQHADENFGLTPHVGPSLLTGAALKALLKDLIVAWYNSNPSENYDEWDTNILTGDSFVLVGGVL